jgi:hypothetical protein
MNSEELLAIRDQIVERSGKPVQEAEPLPPALIMELEAKVFSRDKVKALLAWWILCFVYASLRFDDGCHVNPSDLRCNSDGIRGTSWQTKTERKRRGTPFQVPNVAMCKKGWLQEGWKLFQATMKNNPAGRDFWIPYFAMESNALIVDHKQVCQYGPSLKAFRALLAEVGRMDWNQAKTFTWHSCKATIIDLAAYHGENPMAIGFQGHWKDPMGAMPSKYVRKRGRIATDMVHRVVEQEKEHFRLTQPRAWATKLVWNNLQQGTQGLVHISESCDHSITICRKHKTEHMFEMPVPQIQQICLACARKLSNPCEATGL